MAVQLELLITRLFVIVMLDARLRLTIHFVSAALAAGIARKQMTKLVATLARFTRLNLRENRSVAMNLVESFTYN